MKIGLINIPQNFIGHIEIIGAGGTGSWLIPWLIKFLKSCPVNIHIMDGDVVSDKNILRQNFIASDIGKNKAEVLAERYSRAYGVTIIAKPQFLTKETPIKNDYYDCLPLIICCCDNDEARLLCANRYKKAKYFYLDCGNDLDTGQVILGGNLGQMAVTNPINNETYKQKVILDDVVKLYPEINNAKPHERSCADGPPQNMLINQMTALHALAILSEIFITKMLKTTQITFSLSSNSQFTYFTLDT